MSILDFLVILVVLIINNFAALPFGVWLFVVGALIVERLLRGERL